MQRRIEGMLDEAEAAVAARDWVLVRELARNVLVADAENLDAKTFLAMAEQSLEEAAALPLPAPPDREIGAPSGSLSSPAPAVPDSFAGGRYQVERFLGEGGKKRVYLAHDELLDRDVAFALIKTEGLDAVGHGSGLSARPGRWAGLGVAPARGRQHV